MHYDLSAYERQTSIYDSRMTSPSECACLVRNLRIAAQHSRLRYSEVVEEHISIIHTCIPVFRTDIAYRNPWQRLMGLRIPNLQDEGLRPVRGILDLLVFSVGLF